MHSLTRIQKQLNRLFFPINIMMLDIIGVIVGLGIQFTQYSNNIYYTLWYFLQSDMVIRSFFYLSPNSFSFLFIDVQVYVLLSSVLHVDIVCSDDVWDMKAGIDKSFYSTDSDSSDSDQSSQTRQLFEQGQVYYSSMGKQVHVYPAETSGEIEVTVAWWG